MLDREALNRLFRYGCSLTHDEQSAYDLLQDGLEASLRKAPRDPEATMQYIRSIMRNRFIDQYRRSQRFPESSIDDENEPVHMDSRVLEDVVIAQHDVESLMEGLDPLERELLFLWAVEGYTARELGEATECSRGTVLSRLHRLRKKIVRHSQNSERRLQGGAAR